jgi:pimeloyl-ACP methyl ester carboxylesterase
MLSPHLAGHLVNFLWYRTYRAKEPIREKAFLEQADWSLLELNGIPIQTYTWGKGKRSILLVHGWNGRGAQLGQIALALSEQGFRVVTFDLPAHGRSAGKSTDIPTISATIQALEKHYGPFYAAVSHSFGGMCLLHAVSAASHIERVVTISTPLDIATLMRKFAHSLQLSPKVSEILEQLLEKRFGESVWRRFSMLSWTENLTVPGLVIHDRDDYYVEAGDALQISEAWQGSEVLLTEKLGHHRILAEPDVITKIIKFLIAHDVNCN